jgi:uncharacterized protein (DUF433 family)
MGIDLKKVISADPEILGGEPVFVGTRVPVESLFDHLEAGVSLNTFLEDFPTVGREQAVLVLEAASKLLLTSKNLDQLHAPFAG